MLRHRGTRDLELGGNLTGTQLAVRYELQDAPTVRLGERLDGGFHERLLKHTLT